MNTNNQISRLEELHEILKNMDRLLEDKSGALEESGRKIDSYLMSELENRKIDIEGFEKGIALINVASFEMKAVVESL